MTRGSAAGKAAGKPSGDVGASAGLPARTIFFGSGSFAQAILEVVWTAPDYELVAVISTPDRPAGRGGAPTPTPIAATARSAGLRLLQPERLRAPEVVAAIEALEPDVGILADYGRIVPPAVLASFPRGIVNVHPSLLPRHRGATPIAAAILAGDPLLGVSLIELMDELDAGPVIASTAWPARGDERADRLEQAAAAAGAALLREHFGAWFGGLLQATPQDGTAATVSRPLRRDDGRLDPARSAALLDRQVRAYAGWPGTFLEVEGLRIVVHEARVAAPSEGRAAPAAGASQDHAAAAVGRPRAGELVDLAPGLGLATSDGVLELLRVQPAGGRPMTGAELLRGRPAIAGAIAEPIAGGVAGA